jgi:hypothetical protein
MLLIIAGYPRAREFEKSLCLLVHLVFRLRRGYSPVETSVNKIVIFLLLLSQNNVPMLIPFPATKLEKFAARKNATITTESYFVTRLPADNACNIRLQALILYEAGRENEQVRGLRVEVSEAQRSKDERSTISYIDVDELDPLLRGLNAMLEMTQRGTFLANPVSKETSFSTTGGLVFSMIQRDTERQLRITNTLQPENLCTISREASIVELKNSIEKVQQTFTAQK